MIRELITIFERDLQKLKLEIESFQKEENLWKTTGRISNSAGNLALHLTGNLNHYIGSILGNTGYVRNRTAEFDSKNVQVAELLEGLDKASQTVSQTLRSLSERDLSKPYPEPVFGYEMTTSFMLIHLSTHLSYHLGQINYLRRVLEEK
ncbi:DinB family protein [Rhodohalobacter mucosus]|uniref:DinB superfamily protein n=1 Tax=Rhodohalobacter mucosus TaxID=2079485 RepID=A0A316TPH1_9BACT|nr:DinB family protein [Rhodohalobacter mucosus]PWN06300.1 DinB superfamily protein [Rhodohalobacter mucosus]